MRILALDHGTKRVGVAISDEFKMIAQPLEFIPAKPFTDFIARLNEVLLEKDVELIVVGLPRGMSGAAGPAVDKVQDFVEALKAEVGVPIRTWDERLTTVQANRSLRDAGVRGSDRKQSVDKVAAAILLQSYLDRLAS